MSFPDTYDDPELRVSQPDAAVFHSLDHPVIATVNTIATALVDVLGPMFWAALIVLFLVAEFWPN